MVHVPSRVEWAAIAERSAGLQPWRRLFHASWGLLLVAALEALDPPTVLALSTLASVLALQLLLDGARLAFPGVNVLFFRALSRLVSPRERDAIASSTWYVLGATLAVALFPRPAAIGGILVLALADPAANLVGRMWGRTPLGIDGTVEGTVAFFLVAFMVLLAVAGPVEAAVGAVCGTAVERLPVRLDDNLTIPVAAAAALWLTGVS